MQTSSNFFNKNLFSLEDYTPYTKRTDRYHESHIVPDPLRLKEELTPWTEINPKYNFNTERLIKFKQKVNSQNIMEQIDRMERMEQDMPQVKEIKSEMISNLFNFYKNNKQKKRSTLNNAKRKSQRGDGINNEGDNSWTLPPIDDRQELEQGLVENKEEGKRSNQRSQQKDTNRGKDKKQSANYIESISIREYLLKLKQKQRVFASASSQLPQKTTVRDSNQLKSQIEEFTSSRHAKVKNKPMFANPINSVKQLGNEDITYRYAPIRNPETNAYKKRAYLSPLQSLEQSFQIYKKAAEQEVQQSIGTRKLTAERYSHNHSQKSSGLLLGDKPYWKGNIQLSSLLSSPVLESVKRPSNENSVSPVKKYSTISYSRSFSPTQQNSVELPKISKQPSNHR